MPITQALNSKANVKKSTTNDLPFAPQQPVISSYYATSTLNQTVINLTFSVDTTNSDIFWLIVDGKKLTLGASADYTFTAVAADGTSSQVTLNQSLVSGLNIQAYKMGLKKESEFLTDNRFVAAYDYLDQSFQAFVAQSTFLTATQSSGTPASGKFYSSIQNRAQIVDLTQNLKAQMGIERMPFQQVVLLQNEYGPNGEAVYGVVNDTFGQLRMVGAWSVNHIDTYGAYHYATTTSDFIEVTFYGTGLNLFMAFSGASATVVASVDGGSETSNLTTASYSTVLGNRNYAPNVIIPVVSGLALGVHTVKIRPSANPTQFNFAGVETINESSQIKVNPGVSYLKGQKYTSSSQASFAYNSAVTGTRGGRVLVYQKSDGSIGQAFQAVNASAAYTTSADHTNEEIAKTYFWREFGANRSDDFSTLAGSASARTFTLDDGTTTLMGDSVYDLTYASTDCLTTNNSGNYVMFTFVGTGLDVVFANNGGSRPFNLFVDGVAQGTSIASAQANSSLTTTKICSGLPYGTHTVKLVSSTSSTIVITAFKVYQPKKPSLPAGAVELADYNVMANYAISSAGTTTMGTGLLRKTVFREVTYVGTWSLVSDFTNSINGNYAQSTTAGNYVEYTFFGTGVEYRFQGNSASTVHTISIDGSTNLSGYTTATFGSGMTLNASAGTITQGSNQLGVGVSISGLTLGIHKIRVTLTSGNAINFEAFDVITPIHSIKSNAYADFQNTLPVGSCGISDNRKTTPNKDVLPAQKAWAQAIGVASSPTTTSTVAVPCPDMGLTIKTNGGPLQVNFSINSYCSIAGQNHWFLLYVDGVQVSALFPAENQNGWNTTSSYQQIVPVSAGTHKVELFWFTGGGATLSAYGLSRIITAKEL
jgi:hypothetical protein